MVGTSQDRAVKRYRVRLSRRGLARFEVLGRDSDRELIRALARRIADDDPEARLIRAAVSRTLAGRTRDKGGILAALRRSPLVGAGVTFERIVTHGRKVDL